MPLELASLLPQPEPDSDQKVYGNRGVPSWQCQCGRFAKFLGSRHTYNGQFDGYEYTVNCSRCGVVTVDCV